MGATSGLLRNLHARLEKDPVLSKLQPPGLPLLYEDEGTEMGESSLHKLTCDILHYGLEFFFGAHAPWRVLSNVNLYYSDDDPSAYVSPDIMALKPFEPLPTDLASYRIEEDGPRPELVAEVLSYRTYQEGDLSSKPILYGGLGIEEYIIADTTGELLPRKLVILKRQHDGSWNDEQDADGGITSRLGFRVIIDPDGQLRVLDAATGQRFGRPRETQEAIDRAAAVAKALKHAERNARAAAKAQRAAEARVCELEAEMAKLKAKKKGRKKD